MHSVHAKKFLRISETRTGEYKQHYYNENISKVG